MDQLFRKQRAIFEDAIQMESADERSAFLTQACQFSPENLSELKKLVEDHFRAGSSFLEKPDITMSLPTQMSEREGSAIGPFKLLQKIGEGGFGVVYMAEQQRPMRRKVALKIIKPGMDTKEVIARFEAERQALALMDHPNIARVLDAGETDSGRPFFAMELVRGVPLTEFCNTNKLSGQDRLALFVTVCRAIQHAHHKGIIHRDLKPSNVMVTLHDNKPVPKVIDFGVSKALSQQLTEKTLFTRYGEMIGTPVYMSPEQAPLRSEPVATPELRGTPRLIRTIKARRTWATPKIGTGERASGHSRFPPMDQSWRQRIQRVCRSCGIWNTPKAGT